MAQTTVLHLPGSFSVRVPAVEHRQHILWHTKVSVCLENMLFGFVTTNDDVTMTPCRHFVMGIIFHLPYY